MLTVGLYGIRDLSYTGNPHYVHDHSITFMRDGKILSTIMLERYTGVKHDQRLGKYIIEILDQWVSPEENVRFISVNSFFGNAFISDDGAFKLEPLEEACVSRILTRARVLWYRNKTFKNYEAWVICHEFAHIASALAFGIKFDETKLLVHIDGGASESACSFWKITNGTPELLYTSWNDLKDPVNNFNVGLLGKTILGLTDRDHLSMPGKLMGFAAYGKRDPMWHDYLLKRNFYLGDGWTKHSMLRDLSQKAGSAITELNTRQTLSQDLCACIQEDFEQKVVRIIQNFKKITNADELIFSGGAALNIPTNAILEQIFGVGNVFIPPCPDDSGLSIGAAVWLEYISGNIVETHDPFLNNFDIPASNLCFQGIQEVAKAIKLGKVVALCIDGSEIGPRALGHRSILGRPDDLDLKKKISEEVKKREWYRPVAPALLPSIGEQSLIGAISKSKLSPYMLGNYKVKDDWRDRLCGVVHVDGTTRAQLVHNTKGNRYLYQLLEILYKEYNIPAVINTSFNQQGEPIVHSHQEAIMKLSTMEGIDMVVDNGSLHFS